MPDISNPQGSVHIAHAALISVEAVLALTRTDLPSEPYILRPEHEVLSRKALVEALARVPKPIQLSAAVVERKVQVHHKPLAWAEDKETWDTWTQAVVVEHLEAIRRDFGIGAPILVRSARGSVILSLEEYAKWRECYRLAMPHGQTVQEADSAARALGAAAVVLFREANAIPVVKGSQGF